MICDCCPIRQVCEFEKEQAIAQQPLPSWKAEMRKNLSKFCPLEHLVRQAIRRRVKAIELELELKKY